MEISLKLTDEEIELMILFMDIGICASEEFSKIDYAEWYCKPSYRKKAQKIKHELAEAIKYEYIINSMGDQWELSEE